MGRVPQAKKHLSYSDPAAVAVESGSRNYKINLNEEETFENVYGVYRRLMAGINKKPAPAEKLINSLKHNMIVNNLVEAKVNMAFKDGKLVFDLKKSGVESKLHLKVHGSE